MAKAAPGAPYAPPPYEQFDVASIKAVMGGRADEAQQLRAMDYIITVLCGTYDLSYRPSSDRDTCLAEGRRFVGLQIVKLAKLDMKIFRKAD